MGWEHIHMDPVAAVVAAVAGAAVPGGAVVAVDGVDTLRHVGRTGAVSFPVHLLPYEVLRARVQVPEAGCRRTPKSSSRPVRARVGVPRSPAQVSAPS